MNKEIEEIQQQIGMGVIWFPIEKVQFLLFHISTLEEKVKECRDYISRLSARVKELEIQQPIVPLVYCKEHKTIYMPFKGELPCCLESRLKEITEKWESLKFKVFDLEEKVKKSTSELLKWTTPHEDSGLQWMKEQSNQSSLAAKQAYINALEHHLKQAESHLKRLQEAVNRQKDKKYGIWNTSIMKIELYTNFDKEDDELYKVRDEV